MEKQYQSESINDLSTALSKAQGEIIHAKKSEDNPFFKSKYADLASCIDAAKSPFANNGLSVTQITDCEDGKVTLITQLNHASGQWIRGYYPVNPTKTDPQGVGSAMTYARRYAFCAITGVASEDDDGNKGSGNIVDEKPETAASKKARFANIKKELENADDPAAVWGKHQAEINAFQKQDQQFYDDLLQTAKKRKEGLASMKKTVEEVKEQTNG